MNHVSSESKCEGNTSVCAAHACDSGGELRMAEERKANELQRVASKPHIAQVSRGNTVSQERKVIVIIWLGCLKLAQTPETVSVSKKEGRQQLQCKVAY